MRACSEYKKAPVTWSPGLFCGLSHETRRMKSAELVEHRAGPAVVVAGGGHHGEDGAAELGGSLRVAGTLTGREDVEAVGLVLEREGQATRGGFGAGEGLGAGEQRVGASVVVAGECGLALACQGVGQGRGGALLKVAASPGDGLVGFTGARDQGEGSLEVTRFQGLLTLLHALLEGAHLGGGARGALANGAAGGRLDGLEVGDGPVEVSIAVEVKTFGEVDGGA